MKPAHIKEQREKHLRQVEKRLREIWELQRELGYKKLKTPIRHGWFKEVVLTSKIERYRNYEHIIAAFKRAKAQIWGADKGKADAKWYKGVERHEIYGSFKLISRKAYNKLPVGVQKLFRVYVYINRLGKRRYKYYLQIPKECYRVKFTRAYVTHSKIIDPLLESEEALLKAIREKAGYYNLYAKEWNSWKRGMKKHEYIPRKRGERRRTNALLNQLNGFSVAVQKDELLWQN
ncbi:hypothetical protein [uncultured Kordia sp.]|uniref:hypothetical protein n=1 Tax=uncultured Kordia sp. TaxID=507699 RepID=UPI002630E2CD|nr:hypothetical protein [uncultured Kordia sp.]